MKILHLCTYDFGGAATAAIRIHKSLLDNGLDSKILVLRKKTSSPLITDYFEGNKFNILLDKVTQKAKLLQPERFYQYLNIKKNKKKFEIFSFAETAYKKLPNHPLIKDCDIIHLHWVAYFLDYATFFKKINKPIVWTLHDMNPFLGTYHYAGDEERNKKNLYLENLNKQQCKIKLQAIASLPENQMIVVAPSVWMYEEAKKSQMFKRFFVQHIPTGIDPHVFKVQDSVKLKESLGFNPTKISVLFVAEHLHNYRKGFDFILELLEDKELNTKVEFVAVGNAQALNNIKDIKFLGKIKTEEEISRVYGAADIFLLPSREDNLPNVMLESLACGTPVVGFNLGGMKDLIKDGINGYLANQTNALSLKNALQKCIQNLLTMNRDKIAAYVHNHYTLNFHAVKYLEVYHKLLK